MPVQQTIPFEEGSFFITFTCHKWMNLIEITDSYDLVYKWLDYLKSKGHKIIGYVIMPNHVHVLVDFIKTGQSINIVVGNGKRFMAYDIVKRLKAKGKNDVLATLAKNVEAKRKANNKQHEVWKLSFDWKYCNSYKFLKQKLNYMHDNPCSGKWNLCGSPIDYLYSSAKNYAGELGNYEINSIEE
jgi:REP element-mobilizing transposase RayT